MKKVKIIRDNFSINKGNEAKSLGEEVRVNDKLADDLIASGFVVLVEEKTKAKEPKNFKEFKEDDQ